MRVNEIALALWTVREDAHHAWKLALEGDDRGLEALGRSIKNLERQIIERDTVKRAA